MKSFLSLPCFVTGLGCQLPDFDKRERDRYFPLCFDVLKSVMKYIMAFNHYSYLHWLSFRWLDEIVSSMS